MFTVACSFHRRSCTFHSVLSLATWQNQSSSIIIYEVVVYYAKWRSSSACKDLQPIRVIVKCFFFLNWTKEFCKSARSLQMLWCGQDELWNLRCLWWHMTAELQCAVQHRKTFSPIKPGSFSGWVDCPAQEFHLIKLMYIVNITLEVQTWHKSLSVHVKTKASSI